MIHAFWGNLFMLLGTTVIAVIFLMIILGLIVMCSSGKLWVRVLGWVLSGLFFLSLLIGFAAMLTVAGV